MIKAPQVCGSASNVRKPNLRRIIQTGWLGEKQRLKIGRVVATYALKKKLAMEKAAMKKKEAVEEKLKADYEEKAAAESTALAYLQANQRDPATPILTVKSGAELIALAGAGEIEKELLNEKSSRCC